MSGPGVELFLYFSKNKIWWMVSSLHLELSWVKYTINHTCELESDGHGEIYTFVNIKKYIVLSNIFLFIIF